MGLQICIGTKKSTMNFAVFLLITMMALFATGQQNEKYYFFKINPKQTDLNEVIEKPEVINKGDLLTKEVKRNIEQMLNAQDNKLQIHIHFNKTGLDETIEEPEDIRGDLLTQLNRVRGYKINKAQTSSDEMIKEPEDITEPDHLTKLKEEINKLKKMVTDEPNNLKIIIHFNKTSSDEMIKEPEDITEPDHLTKLKEEINKLKKMVTDKPNKLKL